MTETDSRQLVVFSLAGEQYALPVHQVQEIIRYHPPRSVASPERWVCGVISLRGRIVPVYDIGMRIGRATEVSEQTKIIIAELGSETAGVIVDSVEEVLTVDASQIDPAPAADSTIITSIARIEDRLIALLALESLFATGETPELVAAP